MCRALSKDRTPPFFLTAPRRASVPRDAERRGEGEAVAEIESCRRGPQRKERSEILSVACHALIQLAPSRGSSLRRRKRERTREIERARARQRCRILPLPALPRLAIYHLPSAPFEVGGRAELGGNGAVLCLKSALVRTRARLKCEKSPPPSSCWRLSGRRNDRCLLQRDSQPSLNALLAAISLFNSRSFLACRDLSTLPALCRFVHSLPAFAEFERKIVGIFELLIWLSSFTFRISLVYSASNALVRRNEDFLLYTRIIIGKWLSER